MPLENWHDVLIREREEALQERDEARAQLAQARETQGRLQKRAQEAESVIAAAGLVAERPQGKHGRSLGRALANYAASLYLRERDEARAVADNVAAQLDTLLLDYSRVERERAEARALARRLADPCTHDEALSALQATSWAKDDDHA